MEKKHPQPHDRLTKGMLSHKQIACDLLKTYLPETVSTRIDWTSLQFWRAKLTGNTFTQQEADIVYQADSVEGDKNYFILHTEQQSKGEKGLALRILKYYLGFWEQYQQQHKNTKLPAIFTLVIYNGRKPYPYPFKLLDLFQNTELARESLTNPSTLLDLSVTEDKALLKYPQLGSWLGLLKHGREKGFQDWLLQAFKPLLKGLERQWGRSVIELMVHYIFYVNNICVDKKLVYNVMHKELSKETEVEMSSLAQRIQQEGMQQGMKQGIQQEKRSLAQRMLAKGYDISSIIEMTGLSKDEILDLQEDELL